MDRTGGPESHDDDEASEPDPVERVISSASCRTTGTLRRPHVSRQGGLVRVYYWHPYNQERASSSAFGERESNVKNF